jgi:hypothetical protein
VHWADQRARFADKGADQLGHRLVQRQARVNVPLRVDRVGGCLSLPPISLKTANQRFGPFASFSQRGAKSYSREGRGSDPRVRAFKTKSRHNSLRKRLTSRSFLRVEPRRRLLSRVHRPFLKLPLRAPDGPPEPFAPPCIRQRARPLTAACRHGEPVLVLAPQRGALAKFASRRSGLA